MENTVVKHEGGKMVIKNVFRDGKTKFILCSLLGIVYFFVPIYSEKTMLTFLVAAAKSFLGDLLPLVVLFAAGVFCSVIFIKPKNALVQKHILNIKPITKSLYLLGTIIGSMALFQVGPSFITDSTTGGTALSLVTDVFITVFLAGTVVTLISSFGLLQFVGVMIEPLMRPLYRLPGCAAMDIATSLTTSPAVDIYLSNKLYVDKLYTAREVSAVVTNFSFCSFGFYIVLCEMVGITEYYSYVLLTSIIIAFMLPLITTRIYPLSKIPDTYIDDSRRECNRKAGERNIILKAWNAAINTAQKSGVHDVLHGIIDAAFFSVKTVCFTLFVATFSLIISNYTNLFEYLGLPFVPILEMLCIPEATTVAPSMVIGLIELALPSLLIAGKELPVSSCFFVVVLSTLQIIFLTESANAIMESSIPLKLWQLIITFLVRTIIALPLVALATHIIF